MLQHGDALATWQLLSEPVDRTSLPISARKIADHRVEYLTYQGPISRNRGTVTRVDSGTVVFESFDADRAVIRLSGERLKGRFTLTQSGEEWLFTETP